MCRAQEGVGDKRYMAFWDSQGFSCLPPPNQHWLLFSHPFPLRTVHVLRAGSVSARGPGLHQDVRNEQRNEQSRVQEITEQNLKGEVFLMFSFNLCNKKVRLKPCPTSSLPLFCVSRRPLRTMQSLPTPVADVVFLSDFELLT